MYMCAYTQYIHTIWYSWIVEIYVFTYLLYFIMNICLFYNHKQISIIYKINKKEYFLVE